MSDRIFSRITSKEVLAKGWPADEKYLITDREDKKYLLRISDLSKRDVKAFEFQMMQELYALGIPNRQYDLH